MPATDQLSAPPFVGRTTELAAIAAALSQAESGSGNTIFLAGEGGIGKTRIAAESAARAAKRGWNVATGRAYPVETGVPYAPFSDALLPLLRRMEPAALSVLSRGGMSQLANIFPTLGESAPVRPDGGSDASELKARLLWNFTQFLGRYAAKQPLLIILENLQWADASSLELFHFLARQIGQSRIVLLGTYNETERDSNVTLKSTETSLVRLGVASVHRIAPLTQLEVVEVISGMYVADPEATRPFAALLYGWTRGNPFFVEEILKSMAESGRLHKQGGRWVGWELDSVDLPSTVRDAIGSRVERLGANARKLATLIAVLGTRASYELMQHLSGFSDDELVGGIEELAALRVIEEEGTGSEVRYDFTHPLLQQVIYGDLANARCRLLHASVAESLENFYGSQADEHADELAYHFSRAHTAHLAPKAIKYLSAAGRTALSKYANREAASYLSAALDHVDRGSAELFSPSDRVEILTTLARARQRIGEYDAAMELWSHARDVATETADLPTIALTEHRIGLGCYWSGNYEQALDHYERGLTAAEKIDDGSLIVRLRLARGSCFHDLGRIEEAKGEVERALAAAQSVGNSALLARVHRSLLLLYAWSGPMELAEENGLKAMALAADSGQKMLEWSTHWAMALYEGVSAHATDVARYIASAERIAEEIGSPIPPIWNAELAIQLASGLGDWEAGIARGERSIALARSLGQRTLLPRLLVWTGLIHLWRGEADQARVYLDEAWALSGASRGADRPLDIPSVVPAHHGLATYHLETDNFAEAIRIGEAGLAIADRAGYTSWALQWVLPVIGEAALWNRDFDRAKRHCDRMRVDATRLGHKLGLAWADACEGLLFLLRDGNATDAIPLLRAGADAMEAIPYPDHAARIRRGLGRALYEAGQKDEAMRELRRCHDVFARLGAASELEHARDQLREYGARPPAKSLSQGAAGLTGRELEVARMVTARKSNKEIGIALDISARTVSTHLSNVFIKLGVDSRGALADFVRTNGLLES